MKIVRRFTVASPMPVVWAAFQDIPALVRCLPGAELVEDRGNGVYAGKVSVRLGPFSAAFDGEAAVTRNEAERSGHVEGRGVDRRGGSRSRLVLDYRLAEADAATAVEVDAEVTLTGPIAQFGRTGLIAETANILIGEFVRQLEARLAAGARGTPAGAATATASEVQGVAPEPIRLWRLVRAAVASWIGKLLARFGGLR
jgi:carbon monoxide dehydrogenase subunit G